MLYDNKIIDITEIISWLDNITIILNFSVWNLNRHPFRVNVFERMQIIPHMKAIK
jgi:hypothetical protein